MERALLDPAIEQKMPSSGIYVHIVPPIPGSTERDMKLIKVLFDSAVQTRLMAHAARLLKVKLESITVKVTEGCRRLEVRCGITYPIR